MAPPTPEQIWMDLLKKRSGQLVGGNIEHIEMPEGAYRGPILSIDLKGHKLKVTTLWTAHIQTNAHGMPIGPGWKKAAGKGVEEFLYDLEEVKGLGFPTSRPQDIGEGRVHFSALFGIARVTIFPKGGSRLSRTKVEGL